MKNIKREQIKKVKKNLKQNNNWKEYKKVFINKQMRFLLTKINIIFSNNENKQNLIIDEEFFIMSNAIDKNAWVSIINKLSKKWKEEFHNINWESFALFLFYTYHYSEYYYKKSLLDNLYKKANDFNEINDLKIAHYNKWIKSMYQLKTKNFNEYIIEIIRIIK